MGWETKACPWRTSLMNVSEGSVSFTICAVICRCVLPGKLHRRLCPSDP